MREALRHRVRRPALVRAAVLAALVALAAAGPPAAAGAASVAPPKRPVARPAPSPAYAPGEVLVRFRAGTPSPQRTTAHSLLGARRMREFRPLPGLEQVRLPEGASVEAAVAAYRRRADVLYAEPNYLASSAATPNDPRFAEQWGLANTGQTGGTAGADIGAPSAWDRAKGDRGVLVAVIDSGMYYDHPDLAGNVWTNAGEIAGNSIDDDANGYVDDVHGIDLIDDDGDPKDDRLLLGHGTHVAGTIGAATDNGTGVAGTAWEVSVMPIRVLSALDVGTYADIVAGIQYADARGADIVNLSLGGSGYSQAFYDAIAASPALFCCAAGNNDRDADVSPSYPASFDVANVLSVGASDDDDVRASFSNWGASSVDLFAPGDDILSTTPRWDRVFRDEMTTLDGWDATRYAVKPWALDTTGYITAPSSAANLNYANSDMSWLISANRIDLTGYTRAALRFQYWMDVESFWDSFLVFVSEDTTFTSDERVVRTYGRYGSWLAPRLVDLRPWAGKQVYVAFALASDTSLSYGGVRVDDVEVWGGRDEPTYTLADGTSMASPHAAGAAALLLGEDPTLTTAGLKSLLMSTVETRAALSGLCATGGRLDVGAARTAMGDVDPPVTTISGVPGGWAAADVVFSLSATDTESGVAGTWYALGAGSATAYSVPVTVTAEGTTAVAYWSADASGNVEPTRTAQVRIDRTPPLTASDAQALYEGTATVSLTASDALSGVAGTEYRVDGGAWTSGTVATVGAGGDHALDFRSRDAAGNEEGTRTASFHVVAPYVSEVPAGTAVEVVSDSGVVLEFASVTASGTVTITRLADVDRRLPANWSFVPGAAYGIEPALGFSGEVTVTVPYAPPTLVGREHHLKLFHRNSWGWDEITVGIDTAANTVSGRTASFSPFAVGYSPWEPTSTSNAGSLPTPHKGYAMTTNKCLVCHAVHQAEATGTVLLPAPATNACVYCHVDTALGLKRIYAGLSDAYTADSTRAAFGGGFAHTAAEAPCAACHSVHGAGTLDGGNATKVLKDWTVWRSAPGATDDYSTFALARWPAPATETAKYAQQTAWCTGCHKYFVESYETTVQIVEGGTWAYARSHLMTASGGAYANPAASLSGTSVAWAPSTWCRSCHDAGDVDTTGGVVPSSFPHYTPSNYRFLTVGGSAAASGSDNTTGTVDGLCLRCHRDGAGGGVGLGF